MKCLEKDRNRRYETANGLARDVERLHRAATRWRRVRRRSAYRLRKFYGRNRAAVWIVGLFLGLTYAGASGIYFRLPAGRAGGTPAGRGTRRGARERTARDRNATREAGRERDKVAAANASLRALADRQRRTLYAGAMNLAQAAWESGDARRTLELLRQWVPKPGDERPARIRMALLEPAGASGSAKRSPSGPDAAGPATGLVAAVSRDGTRVAGAVDDLARYTSTIRVWDAASGQELWRAPPVPGMLRVVLVLRQRATAPDQPLRPGSRTQTGPRPACGQ